MKLCPQCNLNWIDDTALICPLCSTEISSQKTGGSGGGKKINYQEQFIFLNKKGFYRGKYGFLAYNSEGENIGIVYMCDDVDSPSYGHCELCNYKDYHNRYGQWHIIFSNGQRIQWTKLCEILENKAKHKVFID